MANADIDRYLGALAATKAEEKQFYLYKSKNEEGESVLVERIYANENLSRELSIGPGSKSDSLACLADDKGRLVFYVGDDDIIKNYQYSERYGDWDSGDVGGLRAAAHPQSKLAAASRDGQHVLYFQSPSGALEEIQYSDNTWRSSPPLSAANLEPVFGTGLSALITADGVRVFYHHKDSSIHQVVLEGGSWTDYPVANTSDALANTRLLAVGFGAKYFLYFELEDKVLMSIQNGERVECGVITPRGLKPPSGKESGDVIFGPGSWPDFNCLIM